jgi:amino acid adenylation domain-containing protein
VLVEQECAAALEEALSDIPLQSRPQVLSLTELAQDIPPKRVRNASRPQSFACVIYTSGSTGLPKGAITAQAGLLNHLRSKISDVGLSAVDVVAQAASPSFVMAIWQFLAPLVVGARVHICADEEMRDPQLLGEAIGREGITVLQVVPSLLRAIVERAGDDPRFLALSRLRWLISTGEALLPDLARSWFHEFPRVPIVNVYGQAECSDDVASHALIAPPGPEVSTVPIGRPIANTRLYVLDAYMEPVPIGVVGELYVGGASVGPGYLNEPEQTRRSFLPDPFSCRRGARLYRTGDLARWRGDGRLEFLGRRDHQVKLRGYRIEPAEVEHALAGHPDVQAAAVLPRDDPGAGTRLVAHIVPRPGREPKVEELHGFLKSRLPAYMLPAGFIFLNRMPLTTAGKLDRSALLASRKKLNVVRHPLVAPRNHNEHVLAAIWAEILKIDKIGVLDNFFDLGGHSLLAGQVLARVAKAFGVSLPIRALFEGPTIEALARRIDGAGPIHVRAPGLIIPHTNDDNPQVVSMAQETVLRLEREFPGLPQFNLPFVYRLQGSLNVEALERSLTEVVRRHQSLRAGFTWIDGQPMTMITPVEQISLPFIFEDLAAAAPGTSARVKALLVRKAELEAEREVWEPFDLSRAPLFRVRLMRLGENDHVFVLVVHHVIVDGWSIGIFLEELAHFYSAFAAGRRSEQLLEVPQFSDFARWQRRWCTGASADRQLAYWKERLRRAPAVFSAQHDFASGLMTCPTADEAIHVPADLELRLAALSRARGATLYMTLLTAFKALLSARTGRNDICVATGMANRSHETVERMIGPVENTILIRTRMPANLSFHEALERVRDSVLEAHARQELPFDLLASRLAEEEGIDPASITQVFFVMQNARGPFKLPGVVVRSFANFYREGQPVLPIDCAWLTMTLRESAPGIAGSCSYKPELLDDQYGQWMTDYRRILSKAAADPEMTLLKLAAHS